MGPDTLNNIYPRSSWRWRGRKGTKVWLSSCVWERKLFIKKPGDIYVQRSIKRQIRGARRPMQLVRQQLGRPLDTLGRLLRLLLFGKGWTARTNTGTLMNGVFHCEWGRPGESFWRGRCEYRGKNSRERGWSDVKKKPWRAVWKILLRCVIFADVHYTLARVKKISGITVLPFAFGE